MFLILILILISFRHSLPCMPRHTSRLAELDRINPINIETISRRSLFPSRATDFWMIVFATSTSRHAAHSSVESVRWDTYFIGNRFAPTMVASNPDNPITMLMGVIVLSPSASVIPLILQITQKPLSAIHATGLEPQPMAKAR